MLDSRRWNARDGVTGALVCRQDVFLQLLEGPKPVVEATFQRISRDDRHLDIRIHVSEPIETRLFGDWAMLHDPAKTLIWTADDIAEGKLERATPAEVTAVFTALEAKARTDPGTDPST